MEAPAIANCPQSFSQDVPLGSVSTPVTWTEPTATDNSGLVPTVTGSHQPGDNFPVGTTQVTYTVSDMAGNQAQCSFSVTIGRSCLLFLVYFGVG